MKKLLLAAVAALFALPAAAQDGVHVTDPYARIIGPSGAAYFRIENHETADDALISATSPDAGMVMLMQSSADANGVMQMKDMADGFPVPAGSAFVLGSNGAHVMLMNLTRSIKAGDSITLTLTFKSAGPVTLTVPVNNTRKDDPGAGPTPNDAESQ